MSATDVVIVGAGPNGLSIASHLSALGVSRRILGDPMGTWRKQMPAGMYMRSEPYGSDFAAPKPGFSVADYCRQYGLDYVDRLGPLSMARFLDYSQWYIDRLVPDVENTMVTSITATKTGFEVLTETGERIEARRVVIATGIAPFSKLPEELSTLPEHLLTHTIEHHDLNRFRSKVVAVVGSGQSALETAALLHESGAEVHVVARRDQISWLTPNPKRVSQLGRIRRPVNKLCEGWHCAFWNNPFAFRRLPADMRKVKATSVLGPAGAWWLKDRVVGHVDLILGHRILGAAPNGSGVRLELSRADPLRADRRPCDCGHRIPRGHHRAELHRPGAADAYHEVRRLACAQPCVRDERAGAVLRRRSCCCQPRPVNAVRGGHAQHGRSGGTSTRAHDASSRIAVGRANE